MKKTVFLASTLLALGVFAEGVQCSNIFGLLPVTSPTKRTLVAVPWCACSATDNQAIAISNIVKTANLTEGDKVHVLNSGTTFDTWELKKGSDNILYWDSVKQVNQNGTASETDTADAVTATRGTAIILIRQNTTKGPFYLYGQAPTGGDTSAVTVAGTSETPAYNLLAAPTVTAAKLNPASQWTDIGDNDTIVIPGTNGLQVALSYKSGPGWGQPVPPQLQKKYGEFKVYETAIPAGTGFWYVSRGGKPTVTWQTTETTKTAE